MTKNDSRTHNIAAECEEAVRELPAGECDRRARIYETPDLR
jgi:hypothetical protein